MKQLLSLALALLPCLAWAQYPSNGNQKITLGEQTTADGLFYRGLAADTTRKPSVDTMAYMLLDTATNIMWHYKKATNNAWLRLNLLPSDTASMLTNYWRSGRFAGTLPVANGGTNRTSMPDGYILHGDGTSVDTAIGLFFDRIKSRLAIGKNTFVNDNTYIDVNLPDNSSVLNSSSATTGFVNLLRAVNTGANCLFSIENSTGGTRSVGSLAYSGNLGTYTSTALHLITDNYTRLTIAAGGNVGIGTNNPAVQLHTTGNVRFANFGAGTATFDASGNISSSDSRLKKQDFAYKVEGLKEIMKLKPVAFKLLTDINERGNLSETQIGFFADDVAQIIPSASFLGNDGYYNYLDRGILAALVKAVQEQQEIIEGLKTRILTLENK